jgi:hypothetical protein
MEKVMQDDGTIVYGNFILTKWLRRNTLLKKKHSFTRATYDTVIDEWSRKKENDTYPSYDEIVVQKTYCVYSDSSEYLIYFKGS